MLWGTKLVLNMPRSCARHHTGALPGDFSPVTMALTVSEDQSVIFDLGFLRASKVSCPALLITHPPDKSHLH